MSSVTIEGLLSKIELLTKENTELKEQIQIDSEKELQYQSTIKKIKQIHSEYEDSYQNAISDYKNREENLKKQFMLYQTKLENQFSQNEKIFTSEIAQLKELIKSKESFISNLIKENAELKQIISNNELQWHCKEKEYEKAIEIKDRELTECKSTIKSITEDTSNKLNNLKAQVEEFYKRKSFPYIENENSNNNINNNNQREGNQNENEQMQFTMNQNAQLNEQSNKMSQEIQFWKNNQNNSEYYKNRGYQGGDLDNEQEMKFVQKRKVYEDSFNMQKRQNEQIRENVLNEGNSYNVNFTRKDMHNNESNNYNFNFNYNYNEEEMGHQNIEYESGKNRFIFQKDAEMKNRKKI